MLDYGQTISTLTKEDIFWTNWKEQETKMTKNMMKTLSLAVILAALTSFSATANDFSALDSSKNTISQGIESISTLLTDSNPSIKRGQPYDASNDPAFKSSSGGPEQTSPEHGYFAVPLIVIGLAGILLYFSKFD
jgi:hypothetical protein